MIKIYDANENELDLFQGNLRCLSINPESPSKDLITDSTETIPGDLVFGEKRKSRKIDADFFIEAADYLDFELLRSRVYALFADGPYYLVDDRQPGKRWKVYCPDAYTITRINPWVSDRFTISFYSPSSFCESIGTTGDPLTMDSELWQFGQGITDDDLIYQFSTNTFSIYNAGDVPIDPRYLPLNIKYVGPSTNLQIKNNTTGDVWTYTGTSSTSDTVELDGVRSLKNSLSIFRDTNKNLITLAKGWNDFELTGTTDPFTISFDFRFYYL